MKGKLETLHSRARDEFNAIPEDIVLFREKVLSFNKAPKFGDDIERVDAIGQKWFAYFVGKFKGEP